MIPDRAHSPRGASMLESLQGRVLQRAFLGVALAALAGLAAAAEPADEDKGKIYLHRDHSGARAFSDQKRIRGYTYLGEYKGRPTAETSCRGMTPERLDARAGPYEDLIARHARNYGLEAALVKAVMRVESCFDARAVSRVGAHGLMQLMPGTAERLGVSDRFSPEQNVAGGTQYLQLLLQRFNGNMILALAAYNAGPEAVERYRGIPPYQETRDYVRRVSAQYQEYLARPLRSPVLATADLPAPPAPEAHPAALVEETALSPLDPGTNLSER